MDIATWEQVVEQALNECNLAYRPQYSSIALVSPRPPEEKGLGADMKVATERHFWRRVCTHKTFGDTQRIQSRFDRSLEDNYGVRSGPFLDVARAYWTFKLELDDITLLYSDTWICQALMGVESDIRTLFFPMPGPITMPKTLRKLTQRQYLQEWAPAFEIEPFLKQNPMLRGWFS